MTENLKNMASKGPKPLYANLYLYAVNKAAIRVLGKSSLVFSRCISDELWSYLA